MSCSLRHLTRAVDWLQVRSFFFPDELLTKELARDEDFDNRWNWDSENEGQKYDAPRTDDQWLSLCHVSLSPDGKLLLIAKGIRLAALYDRHGLLEILTTKTLDVRASDETISSINCVPLASQQKSNEGGIDWIAILIGFSSGKLRVYTDSGCLLLVQKIHDEAITGISCSSFYSSSLCGKRFHPEQPDHQDQIVVSFTTVVGLIEGFAFYQSIRSARSHLAKLALNQNLSQHVIDMGIQLPVTKWSFRSDPSNKIRAMASAGLTAASMYDHLISLSFAEPNLRSKQSQSVSTSLVTVGESPFVGFFETVATDSPSLLNGVAQAVVNRAKNLIPLFGSKKDEAVEAPVVSLAERVGLYDQRRKGLSMVFSPDKKLLAVPDDYGRVTLCDVQNRMAIRMWKGYREAECAFLEVPESILSGRKSLCLVIYARRRGLIEIWRCERGPRIASMNVGKNCALFSVTHHMFGLNKTLWQKQAIGYDKCFVLNRDDGSLSYIHVPFACTLTDANSTAARDAHLLKDLSSKTDFASVEIILKQLRSASTRNDALNYSFGSAELAKTTASILKEQMREAVTEGEDGEVGLYDKKMLLQSCCRVLQLCDLYSALSSLDQFKCRTIDLNQVLPEDIDSLSETMGWQAVDVAKCLSLFSLYHSVVKCDDPSIPRVRMPFADFMKSFHVESSQLHKSADGKVQTENIPIQVKWKQLRSDLKLLQTTSGFLFQLVVDENSDSIQLVDIFGKSCITAKDLLKMLFTNWLSCEHSCRHWCNWIPFSFFSRTISSQISGVWMEGRLSITWKSICGLIVSSPNLPAALVAMFVAKSLSDGHMGCDKNENADTDAAVEAEEDWETLHVDIEKLNIAIKQLEDAFILDLLLRTDSSLQHQSLSLEELIRSNPGIVSELVSKWVVSGGYDFLKILEGNCFDSQEDVSGDDDTVDAAEAVSLKSMGANAEILQHVYRCFPHSLNPQVILVNCCWELASQWHRSPSVDRSQLNACVRYLNRLSSLVLRHNISCLLWKTFVVKKLEALVTLSEKMAKIPKDRICKRDMGMGEDCIEALVAFSGEVLDVIMENVKVAEHELQPVFAIDDWWRNSSEHALPLVMTASSVRPSNPSLVLAHIHLVQVVQFMTAFQMKNAKPLSLFMPAVRHAFFRDLHAHGFETPLSDFNMNEYRRQFLNKVVVAIAHSTPSPDRSSEELLVTPSRAFGESNKLFVKVLTLSREWELSTDVIRRRFVCELYACACDSLAHEVRNSCRDKSLLSIELLPIACRRVNLMVDLEKSAVDPHALQWMQATDCEQTVTSASKESTELLLEFMIANLPDESQTLKVANSLLETIRVVVAE